MAPQRGQTKSLDTDTGASQLSSQRHLHGSGPLMLSGLCDHVHSNRLEGRQTSARPQNVLIRSHSPIQHPPSPKGPVLTSGVAFGGHRRDHLLFQPGEATRTLEEARRGVRGRTREVVGRVVAGRRCWSSHLEEDEWSVWSAMVCFQLSEVVLHLSSVFLSGPPPFNRCDFGSDAERKADAATWGFD